MVSDTITQSELNEYFGFTQSEVEQLLRDMDATEYASEMKLWYDGYHFGDCDVYCRGSDELFARYSGGFGCKTDWILEKYQ